MSKKKSKAGTKEKRCPDGLSLPSQNTTIINIIIQHYIRYEKMALKFNSRMQTEMKVIVYQCTSLNRLKLINLAKFNKFGLYSNKKNSYKK